MFIKKSYKELTKKEIQLLLSNFNKQYVILQTKISDLKKKPHSNASLCIGIIYLDLQCSGYLREL